MTSRDVLITGGSDGIGLAVARLLAAEHGTRLTLVARDAAKLRDVVATLPGDAHHVMSVDLSMPNDVATLASHLGSTHYDVLRNQGVYVMAFNPSVMTTRFHAAAGASVAVFPRALTQSPESVARELVAALRSRSAPRVITGFATRQFVRLQRMVSSKMALDMMGRNSPISERPTRSTD